MVINLAEKMQKYADQTHSLFHGCNNTIMGEGHWNERGHKLASEIIAKNICENFKFF